MTRAALAFTLLAALPAAGQGKASCQPLTSVTVAQRSYALFNVPAFDQRVYIYAPDIKSGWGGGFDAFTLWIIEGVYSRPFGQLSGSLDERTFDQIKGSRNVLATAVPVSKNSGPKRTQVTIRRQPFNLDLVKINTSLGGTDSVSLNLCR